MHSAFLRSEPVRSALIVGGGAAVVSSVVGVFTIIRGQSFAGHALADVSSAGGAASFLLNISPFRGFITMAVLTACGMELVSVRRTRERDLVTGITLGAGLGLAALFLYLDVTSTNTTGAAVTIMFGSMFAISASIIPLALSVGIGVLLVIGLVYRPLLLSSLDPELARVQGVPVRLIGLIHLVTLAMAVSLSAMTIGAILSTALLIGPASTALRLEKRPGRALVIASLIGVFATWFGIYLAYQSFYWTPGRGWPVSFFIVTLVFAMYLLAGLLGTPRGRGIGKDRKPFEIPVHVPNSDPKRG